MKDHKTRHVRLIVYYLIVGILNKYLMYNNDSFNHYKNFAKMRNSQHQLCNITINFSLIYIQMVIIRKLSPINVFPIVNIFNDERLPSVLVLNNLLPIKYWVPEFEYIHLLFQNFFMTPSEYIQLSLNKSKTGRFIITFIQLGNRCPKHLSKPTLY